MTTAPIEAFRYVIGAPALESDYDFVGHLSNSSIARLLADARATWFSELEGRGPNGAFVVRKVTIWYEAESRPGETLRCGVRAVSRTNRTMLLDQMLWSEETRRCIA